MSANSALSGLSLFSCLKQKFDSIRIRGNIQIFKKKISHLVYSTKDKKINGNVFFAIKGVTMDGHAFISDAIEKGAILIVCEVFPKQIHPSIMYLKVPNTRKALAIGSKKMYNDASDKLLMVGITGTNGKTTIARICQYVLENTKGKSAYIGTIGECASFNENLKEQDRTTPESIDLHKLFSQFAKKKSKSVVMEVSSHSLDLHRVYGIEFQIAVFTNLTQDHLDYHHTMEAYFQAKKKLFTSLTKKSVAVINIDDPYGKRLRSSTKAKKISYSLYNKRATIYGKVQSISIKGSVVELHWNKKIQTITIPLIGEFNIYNVLAAIGMSLGAGIDFEKVCTLIEKAKPIRGRMETIPLGKKSYAVVDYAHTPDALEKAIETITKIKSNESKLITVFGCGGDRDKTKRPIMGKIATEHSDVTILTSDNPRSESPEQIIMDIEKGIEGKNYIKILDRKEAIEKAIAMCDEHDVVLVAGKGHETYQIIGDKKIFFDDRQTIKQAIHGKNI